ncbi:MAG TPA: SCO family protein [Gemmatimonadales bacterium]|jgi:protein SCO1/2|nr:SCO family protein [Gemmatimonadales bacterium]
MRTGQVLGYATLAIAALTCKPAGLRPLGEGLVLEPALAKPDLVLTATDTRPFRLKEDTEGKIVLLYFGYTHCPDICPVTMANLAAALGRLSPEINQAVRVIFVTTDPRRDTPSVLRDWLDHFDPRFIGLRGDSAQVAAAMRALRLGEPIIVPGSNDTTYAVEHAAIVLGFTRDNLAHVGYAFGTRQEDWVRNIQALVTQ